MLATFRRARHCGTSAVDIQGSGEGLAFSNFQQFDAEEEVGRRVQMFLKQCGMTRFPS
jgi:hypothetical protein